ncbi:hypothetical protein Fmac_023233 [Flemingia macrophylla]|uniref:Uncharacterized protein n=1 Tax=Flemingia macrophylla TaxID=520843 RepID=A0ABD1LKY7_9FABA
MEESSTPIPHQLETSMEKPFECLVNMLKTLVLHSKYSNPYYYKNILRFESSRDWSKLKPCVAGKGKDPLAWSNVVHFSSNWLGGQLRLPELVFDDNTPYIFRNLVRYEMFRRARASFSCDCVNTAHLQADRFLLIAFSPSRAHYQTMNKELDDDIMDGWLTKLKEAKERFDEKKKNLTPKIQRIPHFLKQNDRFAKYCTPKLISFGPIHHKDPHLKQGEEFKLLWTSNFVIEYSQKMNKDVKQVTNDLCKNIKDDIKELKELFAEDALLEEGYDDNYFTWMLFVDGCSALYFMENVDMHHPEALNIKLDQLMYISRDIYLLENQLPMRLLKLISESGEGNLNSSLFNFHTMGRYKGEGLTIIDIDAIHILDHIRLLMIEVPMEENTIPNQDDNLGNVIQNASDYQTSIYTYKNIRDLKAVGIGVKPCTMSTNPMAWSNVHFSSNCFRGELRLPRFFFNDNYFICFETS